MAWAVKWQSDNSLDGKREYLMGRFGPSTPEVPEHLAGYKTMVFKTRALARAFVEMHYSYIRERPDLRREPHSWKMPVPVKVKVTVWEVS